MNAFNLLLMLLACGCARATTSEPPLASQVAVRSDASDARDTSDTSDASDAPDVPDAREASDAAGVRPQELLLAPGRPIYYAMPASARPEPARLVGHVHGVCGGPSYACGKWLTAATNVGVLVCPTGNTRCGDSNGPASWEAPSWPELLLTMDRDLEQSVARVETRHPHAIRREGAILTGYSRGGYAAPILAGRHPKRWPFLVIIEADATLGADALRRAGVLAVALVAGENGTQLAGMRKSAEALSRAGFPARLFVMPKTGHLYSTNMDEVMQGALDFVIAHEADAGP